MIIYEPKKPVFFLTLDQITMLFPETPKARSRWFWVGWGRVYLTVGTFLWRWVKEPLERDFTPWVRVYQYPGAKKKAPTGEFI